MQIAVESRQKVESLLVNAVSEAADPVRSVQLWRLMQIAVHFAKELFEPTHLLSKFVLLCATASMSVAHLVRQLQLIHCRF